MHKHTDSHKLSNVLYRDFTDCRISEITLWGRINSQTESLAFHTFWFLCLWWQKCKHRVEKWKQEPFILWGIQSNQCQWNQTLSDAGLCVKHYMSVLSAQRAYEYLLLYFLMVFDIYSHFNYFHYLVFLHKAKSSLTTNCFSLKTANQLGFKVAGIWVCMWTTWCVNSEAHACVYKQS